MTNQQLKAHCEDVIANPQDHLDWVVDMARVALTRLEAEPVYQLIDDGNWWDAPKYLFDEAKERGEQHRVVYTAPPVLKPIELPQLISSWEGDDVISGRNRGITDCAEALRKQGYEVKS